MTVGWHLCNFMRRRTTGARESHPAGEGQLTSLSIFHTLLKKFAKEAGLGGIFRVIRGPPVLTQGLNAMHAKCCRLHCTIFPLSAFCSLHIECNNFWQFAKFKRHECHSVLNYISPADFALFYWPSLHLSFGKNGRKFCLRVLDVLVSYAKDMGGICFKFGQQKVVYLVFLASWIFNCDFVPRHPLTAQSGQCPVTWGMSFPRTKAENPKFSKICSVMLGQPQQHPWDLHDKSRDGTFPFFKEESAGMRIVVLRPDRCQSNEINTSSLK